MRRTFWATGSRLEEARALWVLEQHTDAQIAEILTERWGIDVTAPMVQGARSRYEAKLQRKKLLAGGLGSESPKAPAVTPQAASPRPPAPPPPPEEEFEIEEEAALPPAPPAPPAIHTSRTRGEAYLIIPDAQEPYSAPGAVAFALAVAKEEGIDVRRPGSVYNVGDEADLYAFSRFMHSPEAPHTANQELEALRERMRAWYRAFPFVRVCKSNHQQRIIKKAAEAGLPSQVLRAWRELVDAVDGWEWADSWEVRASKHPFYVEHGHHGSQAVNGLRLRVLANQASTVLGHVVTAMTLPVRTPRATMWGMCVGAIVDRDAIAFEYGKPLTWQPCNGVGVVRDGGRMPVWYPYGGNWP